jgi:hypothetical protein
MSYGIRFSTSLSRMLDNLELEVGEIFSPLGLMMVEEFGSHEVLHILVIT